MHLCRATVASFAIACSCLVAVGEQESNAKLLRKEVKDHFKTGPVETEIWAETVKLAPVTRWDDSTIPDENTYDDLRLPAQVTAFEVRDDDSWKLSLTLYPNFNSDEFRIPGPEPEFYGEPMRALISTPETRHVSLEGTKNGSRLKGAFVPGLVYATGFKDGKIFNFTAGGIYPPTIQASRFSPPIFNRGDVLSFAFAATRLHDEAVVINVTPHRIVGDDYTNYTMIGKMGFPFHQYETAEDHNEWIIIIEGDQELQVVAPLWEGRGAGGMIELENLELGPTYEEDVEALLQLEKKTPPKLSGSDDGSWKEILKHKLGAIPESQRGFEDNNMDFTQ